MWLQEIIVGIIVTVCVFYVGKIIWQRFTGIKKGISSENGNYCTDCPLAKSCFERKNGVMMKKKTKTLAGSENSCTFAIAIEKQR